MSHDTMTQTEIRPFHIDVPEEDLAELPRRIGATRSSHKSSGPRSGHRASRDS